MGIRNEKLWLMSGYVWDSKDNKNFGSFLKKLKRKKYGKLNIPSAEIVVNGMYRIVIGFSGSKVGWGIQEKAEEFAEEIIKKLRSMKNVSFDIYEINHGELTDEEIRFNHYEIKDEETSHSEGYTKK